MTVIQPNKNKKNIVKLVILLSVFMVAGLVGEVWAYSQTVNLRHEVSAMTDGIAELRVANAEFKNELYASTDQKNLDKLAKVAGLIQDKNPKWVFASQY